MKHENNLVWIDLEMTGLNLQKDVILEIATIITNDQLEIIAEGPDLVIHHPDSILDTMNDWCKKQHAISGLTQAVQQSTITTAAAEAQTIAFIEQYCIKGKTILCGNSIWQDRSFIRAYMPNLDEFLHYRLVDVTSIKELIKRWYPKSPYADFKKKDLHRALVDIKESIEELKQYKNHFFIPPTILRTE